MPFDDEIEDNIRETTSAFGFVICPGWKKGTRKSDDEDDDDEEEIGHTFSSLAHTHTPLFIKLNYSSPPYSKSRAHCDTGHLLL